MLMLAAESVLNLKSHAPTYIICIPKKKYGESLMKRDFLSGSKTQVGLGAQTFLCIFTRFNTGCSVYAQWTKFKISCYIKRNGFDHGKRRTVTFDMLHGVCSSFC